MSNSLENLKIGDTLGYLSGSRFRAYTRKLMITGDTPKFWLCAVQGSTDIKVRKSDGKIQGMKHTTGWHITEMELAQEKRATHLQERIAKAKRYLDTYHPRNQGLLSLEKMADALEGILKMADSKLPAAHTG